MENKFEVVVIPAFGISAVPAEMEIARRLAAHDPRISVVVLIADISKHDDTIDHPGVTVIRLPPLPEDTVNAASFPPLIITNHMEAYKPVVKDIIRKHFASGGGRLAGFVLDLFCTPMIDVADDLGVPSYFMFATSASALSFYLHFEGPLGGQLPKTPSIRIPGFRNPLPEKTWPAVLKNKDAAPFFARHMNRIRKSKGVLVNTFTELEPDLIHCLSEDKDIAPIFPIGPIVPVVGLDSSPLFDWLGTQPARSVVFLCFGSIGTFGDDQVREIAVGLEKSGQRFLWSLRQQSGPWEGKDYEEEELKDVLPEGFLERTAGVGRVVSWVPQGEVLAHAATAAFVSHCGWNSMIESLLSGVPVAAWPLFAEQHVNAYYWAREAGLATEISMESLYDTTLSGADQLVEAAQVERGIRRVMEAVDIGKRVAQMSLIANNALLHGGSSYRSFTLFIHHLITNVSST